MTVPTCARGWEALRGDPLPWLLEGHRPGLQWRLLVELLQRPWSSPAVRRARGAVNAEEPVASLLCDLHPDGTWDTEIAPWSVYAGPAWRLIAAVAWGADPEDPRLQAAAQRLLDTAVGEGGIATAAGRRPVPWLTARFLAAMAELGWWSHPRFQEALAWLEEAATDWGGAEERRVVTAVAVLAAHATRPDSPRVAVRDRAAAILIAALQRRRPGLGRLGHPNLGRTDLAETLWSLARAEVAVGSKCRAAVRRLQRLQTEGGRWRRSVPVPSSLPGHRKSGAVGQPSRWITLRAVTATLGYAVEAELPRLFPARPAS